jgi:protein-tyrosine phosphatase
VIDLHCHLLPGIDDGARDLAVSLEMARMAVADGVTVVACTPHILPGLYDNAGPQIRAATQHLQRALTQENIPLHLVTGADVHMVPDLAAGLQSGRLLSLADSRYVLVEPPHHVAPVRLEDFFFSLLVAGYVPVLTHPERLSWIEVQYQAIQRMVRAGVWMQITAGSLAGNFGRTALRWANRMLDEGCVHLLASDAHDARARTPVLSKGRDLAASRVGVEEARHLVETRPLAILRNDLPSSVAMPEGVSPSEVMNGEAGSRSTGRDRRGEGGKARAGSGRRSPRGGRSFSDRLRRLFQ